MNGVALDGLLAGKRRGQFTIIALVEEGQVNRRGTGREAALADDTYSMWRMQ